MPRSSNDVGAKAAPRHQLVIPCAEVSGAPAGTAAAEARDVGILCRRRRHRRPHPRIGVGGVRGGGGRGDPVRVGPPVGLSLGPAGHVTRRRRRRHVAHACTGRVHITLLEQPPIFLVTLITPPE